MKAEPSKLARLAIAYFQKFGRHVPECGYSMPEIWRQFFETRSPPERLSQREDGVRHLHSSLVRASLGGAAASLVTRAASSQRPRRGQTANGSSSARSGGYRKHRPETLPSSPGADTFTGHTANT